MMKILFALCFISMIACEINPVAHKPLRVITNNHLDMGTTVQAQFTVDSSAGSFIDDYAFGLTVSNDSNLNTNNSFSCSISISLNGAFITNITSKGATYERNDTLKQTTIWCTITAPLTPPQLNAGHVVTLTVSGFKFQTPFVPIGVSYATTKLVNRIILASNQTFGTIALYNSYLTNNAFLTVTTATASVNGATLSTSTLKPYDIFSLSLNFNANAFIPLKSEAYLFIDLKLANVVLPSALSVTSDITGNSSSLDLKLNGTLNIVSLDGGIYITGITENLIPTRTFKLTFPGLVAQGEIASILTKIDVYVKYINAESIYSYSSFAVPKIAIVKNTVAFSVNHPDYLDYFENSAGPLRFYTNIPALPNGGVIKYTYTQGDSNIHFITSTCDFSDTTTGGVGFTSDFSTKPICVQVNNSINSASSFTISLSASTDKRTLSFIIWAFFEKCSATETRIMSDGITTDVVSVANDSASYQKPLFTLTLIDSVNSNTIGAGTTNLKQSCSAAISNDATGAFDLDNFAITNISASTDYRIFKEHYNFNFYDGTSTNYLQDSTNTGFNFGIVVDYQNAGTFPIFTNQYFTTSAEGVTSANVYDTSAVELNLSGAYLTKIASGTACNLSLQSNTEAAALTISSTDFTTSKYDIDGYTAPTDYSATETPSPIKIRKEGILKDSFTAGKISKLTVGTTCYTTKPATSIMLKSPYNYFEAQVKYFKYTDATTGYLLTRVNRFIKFVGNSGAFSSTTDTNSVNTLFTSYFHFRAAGNTELCLIELNTKSWNASTPKSTLLLTLLNFKLADFSVDATSLEKYPNSLSLNAVYRGGVNVFDTNATVKANNSNITNIDALFAAGLSNTYLAFLGNTLAFTGVTSTSISGSNLIIPVYCPVLKGVSELDKYLLISNFDSSVNTVSAITNLKNGGSAVNKLFTLSGTNDDESVKVDHGISYQGYAATTNVDNISITPNIPSNFDRVTAYSLASNNWSFSENSTPATISFNSITGAVLFNKILIFTKTDVQPSLTTITGITRPQYGSNVENSFIFYSIAATGRVFHTHSNLAVPVAPASNKTIAITGQFLANATAYAGDLLASISYVVTVTDDFPNGSGTVLIKSSNISSKSNCSGCTATEGQLSCPITTTYVQAQAVQTYTLNVCCEKAKAGTPAAVTADVSTSYTPNGGSPTQLTEAYRNEQTTAVNVSTIVAKITSFSFGQVSQTNGLGTAYIKVDLGRIFKHSQVVTVTFALSGFQVNSTPITNCKFFIDPRADSNNTLMFKDYSLDYLVDTCTVGSSSITFTLKDRLYKCGLDTKSTAVIVLSPVTIIDISATDGTKNHSVTGAAYDATLAANYNVAPPSDFALPKATINSTFAPTTSFGVNDATKQTRLCSVTAISPLISGVWATWDFTIDLSNKAKPNGIGSRVLNSISLYLDDRFIKTSNFKCKVNSEDAPCEFNDDGFFNVRFNTALADGSNNNVLRISGIRNPVLDSTNNSGIFCSVNYYDSNADTLENVYVGDGAIGFTTFFNTDTKNNGNLLIVNEGVTYSSNNPRADFSLNLKIKFDNTAQFDIPKQDFTANSAAPAFIFSFPSQFEFSKKFSATIGLVERNTDAPLAGAAVATDYVYKTAVTISKDDTGISLLGLNSVIINCNPFTTTDNFAYFVIQLTGVQAPQYAVDPTSLIRVTLIDNYTTPTQIFVTYQNFYNSTFKKRDPTILRDYNTGLSFAYDQKNSVLNAYDDINGGGMNVLNITRGRYSSVRLALDGNVSAKAEVSLSASAAFKLYQTSVVLNSSGISSTSVLIGAPCSTNPGSYYGTLALKNTSGNIAAAPIIRINLSKIGTVPNVTVRYALTSQNVAGSALTIVPGGATRIFFYLADLPVEKTTFTIANLDNSTNPAKFTYDTSVSIAEANQSVKADFKFDDAATTTTVAPKVSVAVDNKCYTLTDSTLSFTIGGTLQSLPLDTDFSKNFSYNAVNSVKNQISILYKNYKANTKLVCELICNDADVNTVDSLMTIQGSKAAGTPRLVQFAYYFFDKDANATDSVELLFTNLQRATQYKLHCALANNKITPDTVQTTITQFITSDVNKPQLLQTAALASSLLYKVDFSEVQADGVLNAVYNAFIAIAGSYYVDSTAKKTETYGYVYTDKLTCDKGISTKEFSAAKTLRYLTDATTTTATSSATSTATTTTATSSATSSTTATTVAGDSIQLQFKQSYNSADIISVDDVSKSIATLNKVEAINSAIASTGYVVKGTTTLSQVVEEDIDTTKLSVTGTYDGTSSVTLNYVGNNSNLYCDYKIRIMASSSDPNTYADLSVVQCNTAGFCGYLNITKTQGSKPLSLSNLAAGAYNIDLRCKNNFSFTTKVISATYTLFTVSPPKPASCFYPPALLLNGTCCNNVTTNGNKSTCCASNSTVFNNVTNTTDCSSSFFNLSILLLLFTAFFYF